MNKFLKSEWDKSEKYPHQAMWWYYKGYGGPFWYAEFKLASSYEWVTLENAHTFNEIQELFSYKYLKGRHWSMTYEIQEMPFTSVDIFNWINNYCIDLQLLGNAQFNQELEQTNNLEEYKENLKKLAIIQVPKNYGLRIQSYYNHYSMVCDWDYKIKLSKRCVRDCKKNNQVVIPADDMVILTACKKSEKQRCVDECRLKHLSVDALLMGDI